MSRTPLLDEPPLLEPERALRLVEDVRAFLNGPDDQWLADDDGLAIALTHDAVMLALDVGLDTGDPRLLAAALDLAEDAASEHEDWDGVFASAAEALLPHVHEVSNRVRECGRSKSDRLRCSTARSLAPRALRSMRGDGDDADAEAAGIVFALANDEVGWVRKAAREALGGIAPPAWAPFFPGDPLASRSAAEASALRGPLDRAAELLERAGSHDARELAGAIADLPDELALPLLEAFMRVPHALRAEGAGALIERWVRCDPDGARLLAWIDRIPEGPRDLDGERIGEAHGRRSPEQRTAIGLRLAALLPDLGERVVRAEDRAIYALTVTEAALKAIWPDDADPTPLLELRLGAPLAEAGGPDPEKARYNLGVIALGRIALAPRVALAQIVEPLVDALLAKFPGRWKRIEETASSCLLEVSHPRLRAHAEARVREGEGKELAWALRYLVAGGHDGALDPEPDAILAAAALDARLRAAMVDDHHLCAAAREPLRAQLAEGALSPHEAIVLARSIVMARGDAMSAVEWAQVRRAREEADVADRAVAVYILLHGAEWTEDDRAFAERVIDAHGADAHVANLLALGFHQRPAPEHVPLLERLLAHPHDRDVREELADALDRCRDAARSE